MGDLHFVEKWKNDTNLTSKSIVFYLHFSSKNFQAGITLVFLVSLGIINVLWKFFLGFPPHSS